MSISKSWWVVSLGGRCVEMAGKMTMVGMYAAGTTYEVSGKGFDPEAFLHFGILEGTF